MQMAAQIHDELIADKVIQLRLKRQQKWQQHLDIVNRSVVVLSPDSASVEVEPGNKTRSVVLNRAADT